MTVTRTADEVLAFWFGELDGNGMMSDERRMRMFRSDADFDAEIRAGFLATYEAVAAGDREDWLEEARSGLAYVTVLDQFSRNMFRDHAQMYDADPQALQAAIRLLDAGADRELQAVERGMLAMPLMHDETTAVQRRCVQEFMRLRDESDKDGPAWSMFEQFRDFAQKHCDMVERWGRFPHRNEILGRTSTPEELEFLKQPDSSF